MDMNNQPTTKHLLRRPLNEGETMVRVVYGADQSPEPGVVHFGHFRERIEIDIALPRWNHGNIARVGTHQARTDKELCEMAWTLLEKDRFDAHGLNFYDCLSYQLGVRSPMVGDIFEVHEADFRIKYFVTMFAGFGEVDKAKADELLAMSSSDRHLAAMKLRQDEE